jgi:hypothetical protein
MNSIYSQCFVFANICMLTIPFFLIRRHHYNTTPLHKFDKRITPNIRTVACLDLMLLFIAHAIKRCYSPPSFPIPATEPSSCQLPAKHFHSGPHCELFLTKKQQSAQTLQLLNSSIELGCDGVPVA